MTGITVLKSNIPHGPFTRAEIAEKLRTGEIAPDSLAYVEGLAQWTPLRDVLAKVDDAPSPHGPIGTGFDVAQRAHGAGAPPAGAGYSYAVTMQPPSHLIYAGFWLRFAAALIDGALFLVVLGSTVLVCLFVVPALLGVSHNSPAADPLAVGLLLLLYAIAFVAHWLYFALMESSRYQATLGKIALGLQVTSRQGGRITFGTGTKRAFAKSWPPFLFPSVS